MHPLKTLLLASALTFGITCYGQFHPQHTQYLLNNYLINPAIGGIERYTDIKMGLRSQWTQVDGNPQSLYLTAHLPVYTGRNRRNQAPATSVERLSTEAFTVIPHHGLGLKLMGDRTGAYRRIYGSLSYAYPLPLSHGLAMSLGAAGGFVQHHLDRSEIDIQDPSDPLMGGDGLNDLRFDLSVGWWLYGQNFYLGISALQLLNTEPQFLEGPEDTRQSPAGNYFITAGYRFFADRAVSLAPTAMVRKAAGTSWTVDLALRSVFYDRFWAGLGVRNWHAVVAYAGMAVNPWLEIGYSYDQGTSDFDRFGFSTHEILIGFRLNNRSRVHCPQRFW